MSTREFDIDPRNKLGGEVQWEDGDDFTAFVDALNRGVVVRSDGVPSQVESGDDVKLDAVALAELRARFASYR